MGRSTKVGTDVRLETIYFRLCRILSYFISVLSVLYVDYGNVDYIPASALRRADGKYLSLAPQAQVLFPH